MARIEPGAINPHQLRQSAGIGITPPARKFGGEQQRKLFDRYALPLFQRAQRIKRHALPRVFGKQPVERGIGR